MALPAPAVMKAVPMLMSLLRQAKAEEDHAIICQLYHDAAEEEVDVSGVDESISSIDDGTMQQWK